MNINNIALGLLFYFVEFAKLFPLMFWVFEFKLKPVRQTVLFSIITIAATIIGSNFFYGDLGLLGSIMCIAEVILILKGKLKALFSITVYICVCMFDMLAISIILLFFGGNYIQMTENNISNLLINSICIIAVIITVIIAKLIKKKTYSKSGEKINVFYLIIILIGELSILMFITGFQMMNNNSKFMAAILSLSSIAFIAIVIVMIFNYISKAHYKNATEINNQLLISQENYYTMLLKKDNETIKFRHDINNHLNCMFMLFKEGKHSELNEYFENLCNSLSELRPTVQTGNDIVSAILNDMISKYPDVSLKTEGRLPQKIKLNNMDLCTIFSNLFDNAFKAANASQNKVVEIYFKFVGINLLCEIKNSVDHKAVITNNELQTDNDDKINHGHGTQNARKCAEKNEGSLTFQCTDELFLAELFLPVLQ